MSTNGLKKIYEKIPKGIKYAFAPIFISLMVKNKEFIKTWNELDQFEASSKEEQEKIQLDKLKEILIYAYQGEIVSKSEVLKQFKLKVKRSQDQLVLDEWEECDLLLREIFAAFEK